MRERTWLLYKGNIIEIQNISNNDDEFVMNPEQVYNYSDGIEAIIHSHEDTCSPSYMDLNNMMSWKIPWFIISKRCIKSYLFIDTGVIELNIDPFLLKELENLIMHLS